METKDITTLDHDGYRNFAPSKKTWGLVTSTIYVDDDQELQTLLDALDNGKRVYIKYVPNKEFTLRGGRRLARLGATLVHAFNINVSVSGAVTGDFSFLGVGPYKTIRETELLAAVRCEFCCEPLNGTIYLIDGEPWQAPPAPPGAIGWIVEKNFEPVEKGLGDIGLITVNSAPGSPGAAGCPVQVTFRYICEDSEYIPADGTALEQFIEIADNTNNAAQLDIIKIMEAETGLRLGATINGNHISSAELYIAFNFDFLIDNPDYILDISFLGTYDLSIVNTFTNLKKLNASNNNIGIFDMANLTNVGLTHLDASHNLIGQDTLEMAQLAPTLKYLDLSYNYLNECYMYSPFGIGFNVDVDYFDISYNYLADITNSKARIKNFKMIHNVYPDDSIHGNNFWESRKYTDPDSAVFMAKNLNASYSYAITENINLSSSELENEVADIAALVAQIATDKGITTAEAEYIVKYNPTYTDILPQPQYNPRDLPQQGF